MKIDLLTIIPRLLAHGGPFSITGSDSWLSKNRNFKMILIQNFNP